MSDSEYITDDESDNGDVSIGVQEKSRSSNRNSHVSSADETIGESDQETSRKSNRKSNVSSADETIAESDQEISRTSNRKSNVYSADETIPESEQGSRRVSNRRSVVPSADVTVAESDQDESKHISDDESDESIVGRRKITKRKAIIDSGSDESDNENENTGHDDESQSGSESEEEDDEDDMSEGRALSPHTRMSMTGVRPKDLPDDSSEIEYSDENESSDESESSESSSDNENKSIIPTPKRKTKKNSFINDMANAENENNENNESVLLASDQSEASNTSVNNNSTAAVASNNAKEKPVAHCDSPFTGQRYSLHFENAIKEKLSSTIYQNNAQEKESSSDSDLFIVSNKEKTIELSSDDDDNDIIQVKQPESASTPATAAPPLIQPKLPHVLKNRQTDVNDLKYVSKEFYDKEMQKVCDLQTEKLSAEKLVEKIGGNLPDGGRQLKLRIERLNTDIEIKTKYISTLKIDNGEGILKQSADVKKPFFNPDVPDWDDLSEAVGQVQPKYTGKRGLANFNNQKALTVDRLKDLHGSLENCPDENVLADDPKGLKVQLMPHQKHALAWMGWREKQKPRGGILADDMGLGKTLTMIALVLRHKNEDEDVENDSNESDTEETGGTGWKSKGRRDYYPGGTLVICPASLLRQWENEIKTKVSSHKLTICLHHGNNREWKPKHLRTYDIVATTYQIVAREHKNSGTLFGLNWRRIILDEAHVIRNHKAQSSMAVCGLRAKSRWALTGTPIQNKEMDLYALLKFLRCSPFDDLGAWKKWIDKSAGGQQRLNTIMKSLMLRRTKVQLQEIGQLQSLPNKTINVVEVKLSKDEMNVYQKIMVYSRTLFAQFLLQQAERDTGKYMAESYKPSHLQKKDANEAYFKMHQKFTKMHSGKEQVKSHEILVLLLRLRQICCHPGLIDAMLDDVNSETDGIVDEDASCSNHDIDLLDQLQKLRIENNSHELSANDNDSIDADSKRISKASANILQRNNPVFNLKRPSSKLIKILDTISNIIQTNNEKAIVVSQWTSVLNILKEQLANRNIQTLSLNGSIAVKDRQDIVNDVNNPNSKIKVLLLSLTAGGVGLNLIGANHLILVDLHWNPQLEAQAQDRIYRVGQQKDVYIHKFMVKDTVEERIKALQDHKLAVANGVLTGAKIEGSKLSMDDLKSLFAM